MGIDAQIFVKTTATIRDEDIMRWRYELASAFGSWRFWIWRDTPDPKTWRHCMKIVDEYSQVGDSIFPKEGETLIEVYPCTRYYGEGYERGDLPFLIMVSEWLEKKIPNAEVFYGGDSGGAYAEKFDKQAREKLFTHFVKHAHFPYIGGFDKRDSMVMCDFCKFPLIQNGFGPANQYQGYYCPGCGHKTYTNDGGITWVVGDKFSNA